MNAESIATPSPSGVFRGLRARRPKRRPRPGWRRHARPRGARARQRWPVGVYWRRHVAVLAVSRRLLQCGWTARDWHRRGAALAGVAVYRRLLAAASVARCRFPRVRARAGAYGASAHGICASGGLGAAAFAGRRSSAAWQRAVRAARVCRPTIPAGSFFYLLTRHAWPARGGRSGRFALCGDGSRQRQRAVDAYRPVHPVLRISCWRCGCAAGRWAG